MADSRAALRSRVSRFIFAADYGGALALLRRRRRESPEDFFVAYEYASVLGDYAESLPPRRRARAKRESIGLMRALLLRSRAEPDRRVLFALKNEFYWQTGNRRAQYRLGAREARLGLGAGAYSQGVGAAWHAYELAARGRRKRARRWALRSVAAWARYRRIKPGYYNPYVHLALALGVLGRRDAAEGALGTAARLCGKPPGYREFAEIRDLLARLSTSN